MTHDDDSQDHPDAKPRLERSRKGKPLGDYEVGYGRPPAATRFTSSGNPKGRPPGARSLRALVSEALDAKIRVREGGRDRKMSKRQIGATKIANRFAEKADDKTAALIIKLELGGESLRDGHTPPPLGVEAPHVAARRKAVLDWYAWARMEAEQSVEVNTADPSEDAQPILGGDDDR